MDRNARMVGFAALLLGVSFSALATMDIQKEFVAKYPEAKAKLGRCTTCHVKAMPKKGDAAENAYGKDLLKAVVDPKAPKKTYDFAKVEGLDSNGDGVKNIDHIKAGTNPGEAKK